jgi:hypothetical protein
LDRLCDGLEPNGVEVQIEVPNHFVDGCPCIRRFRSPDGWVFAGTVPRMCPRGTHHVDAVGLDGWVPANTAPDLKVVFDGVLISGRCSDEVLLDVPAKGWKIGSPIGYPCDVMADR